MSNKKVKNEEKEVIEGQIMVNDTQDEKVELTNLKEEKRTKGFKLTNETIAELAALEGKFSSAEDFMKTLIATYRTQRIDELGYEARIKDIEQFNSLIESLRILFVASVELEKTTTDRVGLEFREKIDKLRKSLATVTSEKIEISNTLKENNIKLEELTRENEELLKQLELVQNLVFTKENEINKERGN